MGDQQGGTVRATSTANLSPEQRERVDALRVAADVLRGRRRPILSPVVADEPVDSAELVRLAEWVLTGEHVVEAHIDVGHVGLLEQEARR